MSIHPQIKPMSPEERAHLRILEHLHAEKISVMVQGFMADFMRNDLPGQLEQWASLRGMLAAMTQLSVMMQYLLITQHGVDEDDLARWMNDNASSGRAQLSKFDNSQEASS